MALTFHVETMQAIKEEAADLLRAHWEEVALDRDTVPLDPDWEVYDRIEAAGRMCVVTARDAGRLVGYSLYILTGSLHYRSLFVAESDVFFLAKSHRGARAGIRLLQYAEETLRARGVNKLVTRTKLHHDLGPMLEYLGFSPIERVYWKNLGNA